MKPLTIGDKLPEFTLKDADGVEFQSKEHVGKKNLVIYFYPKDDTPGCRVEAITFRDAYREFLDAGAEVIGISADSEESHQKFIDKCDLPFVLLSDEQNRVRDLFGVPRSWMGLLPGRVTYIVDKEGTIREIVQSQVQIRKHVDHSLRILKSLN